MLKPTVLIFKVSEIYVALKPIGTRNYVFVSAKVKMSLYRTFSKIGL